MTFTCGGCATAYITPRDVLRLQCLRSGGCRRTAYRSRPARSASRECPSRAGPGAPPRPSPLPRASCTSRASPAAPAAPPRLMSAGRCPRDSVRAGMLARIVNAAPGTFVKIISRHFSGVSFRKPRAPPKPALANATSRRPNASRVAGHHSLLIVPLRHIADDRQRPLLAAELRRELPQRIPRARGQHQAIARAGRRPRRRRADPARCGQGSRRQGLRRRCRALVAHRVCRASSCRDRGHSSPHIPTFGAPTRRGRAPPAANGAAGLGDRRSLSRCRGCSTTAHELPSRPGLAATAARASVAKPT